MPALEIKQFLILKKLRNVISRRNYDVVNDMAKTKGDYSAYDW